MVRSMEQRLDELNPPKPYQQEPPVLMLRRWRKLQQDLYDSKTDRFDVSKLPDLFDAIKYHMMHNNHFKLAEALEVYELAEAFAEVVVPQEYGLNGEQKLKIGYGICMDLTNKLVHDLRVAAGKQTKHAVFQHELTHRINSQDTSFIKVKSPDRHVRTRLYFSSESHVHALLNVLRVGEIGQYCNRRSADRKRLSLEQKNGSHPHAPPALMASRAVAAAQHSDALATLLSPAADAQATDPVRLPFPPQEATAVSSSGPAAPSGTASAPANVTSLPQLAPRAPSAPVLESAPNRHNTNSPPRQRANSTSTFQVTGLARADSEPHPEARGEEAWQRAQAYLARIDELNYLCHIVFRLFEQQTEPHDSPDRYFVELLFSPGERNTTDSSELPALEDMVVLHPHMALADVEGFFQQMANRIHNF